MLETIVTLFLVALLIVAFIGVTSYALLLALYGPGAAAGFAAGVTASRMGADPLTAIAIAVATFIIITGLVMRLLRMAACCAQALGGREGQAG